jgi:hypothetical protein
MVTHYEVLDVTYRSLNSSSACYRLRCVFDWLLVLVVKISSCSTLSPWIHVSWCYRLTIQQLQLSELVCDTHGWEYPSIDCSAQPAWHTFKYCYCCDVVNYASLEIGFYRVHCQSARWYMSEYGAAMELYWQGNMKDTESYLSQCHFVHHKSHTDRPWCEPGQPR